MTFINLIRGREKMRISITTLEVAVDTTLCVYSQIFFYKTKAIKDTLVSTTSTLNR